MQIKLSTDYAIRMIVYLAVKKETVSSKEISEVMAVPRKYLINITKRLREEGIIEPFAGVKGGYSLSKDPKATTLYEIIDIMEGTTRINRCLEDDAYCSRYATTNCPVREFYTSLQSVVDEKLKGVTVQDLINKIK